MVKITEVTKITTHGTFETHGTIATHETIGRYGTQKYFMKQTWVWEDWTRLADFQFFFQNPRPPEQALRPNFPKSVTSEQSLHQGSRSARLSPQSMIHYARKLFKCSIRKLETTR